MLSFEKYERLGGDVVILGLEGVVNAHDGAPDAEFTAEDYAELEKNVFFALWNGEPPSSSLWRRTIQFLTSLVNKNNSDFLCWGCRSSFQCTIFLKISNAKI